MGHTFGDQIRVRNPSPEMWKSNLRTIAEGVRKQKPVSKGGLKVSTLTMELRPMAQPSHDQASVGLATLEEGTGFKSNSQFTDH